MSTAGDEGVDRPTRTDRTERLLSLVVVLMGSELPVSRATIRSGVPGYAGSPTEQAFERMFERDKDELRSMGVPIDTVRDAHDEVLGYRVEHADYALPDLRFTPAERSVIAVAAQVWGQANLAHAAGSALRKLDAADDEPWTPAGLRGSVQLSASDAALPPLMTAVQGHEAVRFPYRGRADDAPRERTVTPWGLRSVRGAWFCVGYDHGRQAQRTFRLSRVTGTVDAASDVTPVPAPPGFDVSQVPLAPATGEPVVARVRVQPGRAAAVRQLATDDEPDRWAATELTIAAGSVHELVAVVCGAGTDAVVLDPPEIVNAVRSALAAVLTASVR